MKNYNCHRAFLFDILIGNSPFLFVWTVTRPSEIGFFFAFKKVSIVKCHNEMAVQDLLVIQHGVNLLLIIYFCPPTMSIM